MEFKMANVSTPSKNASVSADDAFMIIAAPNLTSSPVSSPNNNIFNGVVVAVTRAPIKPIKSRHLSGVVENLN
jgi:hypothetical protein